MTTYIEATSTIADSKLNEMELTDGERKFLKCLIDCQLSFAVDVHYPVHPTEDVALKLGLSKKQGAGFVSSLKKKGALVIDEDGLIAQNIMGEEEVLALMEK